jgi:hypothetical protein
MKIFATEARRGPRPDRKVDVGPHATAIEVFA